MSIFDQDDDIMYVVEDVEAAEKQMKENNGCFSGNLIPKVKHAQNFKLVVFSQEQGAERFWDEILKSISQSNIKVRPQIYADTKTWQKQNLKWFAAVFNETTYDSPVMALLSKKKINDAFFINHINTNSPLMPLPYVTMLLDALEKMAHDLNCGLIIPKRYQVCRDAPIQVEAQPQHFSPENAENILQDNL